MVWDNERLARCVESLKVRPASQLFSVVMGAPGQSRQPQSRRVAGRRFLERERTPTGASTSDIRDEVQRRKQWRLISHATARNTRCPACTTFIYGAPDALHKLRSIIWGGFLDFGGAL